MPLLKRFLTLLALSAALLLAGCSSLTLAYQQLPLLAGLWANSYFDLDSAQRARLGQEFPNGIGNWTDVCIHNVRDVVGMARDVKLHHAMHRQRAQVLEGIEAVILGAHVDVVHVQEQACVRLFRERPSETPRSRSGRRRRRRPTGHGLSPGARPASPRRSARPSSRPARSW